MFTLLGRDKVEKEPHEKQENYTSAILTRVMKYLMLLLLIYMVSCTDQGDPIQYSLSNSTNQNIEVILFERFGTKDTSLINSYDFKILDEEVPPYDSGPFGGYDSMRIQFEDLKVLTYIPPGLTTGCIDSVKNPFCPYTNYLCANSICTFEIDSIEYQKAK